MSVLSEIPAFLYNDPTSALHTITFQHILSDTPLTKQIFLP
jgi:hypothetical protein